MIHITFHMCQRIENVLAEIATGTPCEETFIDASNLLGELILLRQRTLSDLHADADAHQARHEAGLSPSGLPVPDPHEPPAVRPPLSRGTQPPNPSSERTPS